MWFKEIVKKLCLLYYRFYVIVTFLLQFWNNGTLGTFPGHWGRFCLSHPVSRPESRKQPCTVFKIRYIGQMPINWCNKCEINWHICNVGAIVFYTADRWEFSRPIKHSEICPDRTTTIFLFLKGRIFLSRIYVNKTALCRQEFFAVSAATADRRDWLTALWTGRRADGPYKNYAQQYGMSLRSTGCSEWKGGYFEKEDGKKERTPLFIGT